MQLPIEAFRTQIVDTVTANPVTIIVGEAGSGKTTMLPYYLYKAGLGWTGRIGVTQPRRLAALSITKFLLREFEFPSPTTVACQVRFDNKTDSDTEIKFMTNGILLRELRGDPLLSKYAVVIIDEAHERSIEIDLLLGLIKRAMTERHDLKLVVASATIDAEKFSAYFDNAPVITVSGACYPVTISWSDRECTSVDDLNLEILARIASIRNSGESGDILVFLPLIRQINKLIELIDEQEWDEIIALPAHGMLSDSDMSLVFEHRKGKRKVIVATTIAETSITIDGLGFVIDCGLVNQAEFYAREGVMAIEVTEHSQAGCDQRARRVGRTAPGVCYRLYTEENYTQRPRFTETEIRRQGLDNVVLLMEDLSVPDVRNFPFIDKPDAEVTEEGYRTLKALGAIAYDTEKITELGRQMAQLPLPPTVARMILAAQAFDCVEDVATIAVFILQHKRLYVHASEQEEAERHKRFGHSHSDAFVFLDIWNAYEKAGGDEGWCRDNFLNFRMMKESVQIRTQLLGYLTGLGIKVSSTKDQTLIRRALATGFAFNLLERVGGTKYQSVIRDLGGINISIHPSSSLFGTIATYRWIVASEIYFSTKVFARTCTAVDPAWLPDMAPEKFSFGASSLKEPMYQSGEWTVCRWVEYKNHKGALARAGEAVVEHVPLSKARKLQEGYILEAKEKGWMPLVIGLPTDGQGGMIGTADDGTVYPMCDIAVIAMEEGNRWYCSPDASVARGMNFVRPQFRIFDFIEEATPSVLPGVSKKAQDDLDLIFPVAVKKRKPKAAKGKISV